MVNFLLGYASCAACLFLYWAARRLFERIVQKRLDARDAVREVKNELRREAYLTNPQIPLKSKARSLVRGVINKEKQFRVQYGFSVAGLITSLEGQFEPSMSFENFGEG